MNAPFSFLSGRTVGVMGLGTSGQATARALTRQGAYPLVWDDNERKRIDACTAGFSLADPAQSDLSDWFALVWSPGIPHTHPRRHPAAEAARTAHVPLICDVDLLLRPPHRGAFIGITGTNGKSTTTTLLDHLLRSAGWNSQAGGNLGTPALELKIPENETDACILELSSYQLELIDTPALDVAVLLNITPDHLGRHGGMDGYQTAKQRIFTLLKPEGTAVIGIDDPLCAPIATELREAGRNVVPVTATSMIAGPAGTALDLRSIPTLLGRHNWQNAHAAFAAARAVCGEHPGLIDGLLSYPGLAHRQQRVAIIDGVTYVNDSKATNADAVEKALVCYDSVYWIIGGQAKEGGIESLRPHFHRIRHAFLIGEAADLFARTLEGSVPFTCCGTLDVAVAQARTAALREKDSASVVLLSPACASWDQFRSFEHRGDVFINLVNALPGERS